MTEKQAVGVIFGGGGLVSLMTLPIVIMLVAAIQQGKTLSLSLVLGTILLEIGLVGLVFLVLYLIEPKKD